MKTKLLLYVLLFCLSIGLVTASDWGGSAGGAGGGSSSSVSSSVGTASGDSGSSCVQEWVCSSWSYCDASLQQSRRCREINGCRHYIEIETQDCSSCLESWICRSWSECSEGKQTRECFDEHLCETTKLEPDIQRDCKTEISPEKEPREESPQKPLPWLSQIIQFFKSLFKLNP